MPVGLSTLNGIIHPAAMATNTIDSAGGESGTVVVFHTHREPGGRRPQPPVVEQMTGILVALDKLSGILSHPWRLAARTGLLDQIVGFDASAATPWWPRVVDERARLGDRQVVGLTCQTRYAANVGAMNAQTPLQGARGVGISGFMASAL